MRLRMPSLARVAFVCALVMVIGCATAPTTEQEALSAWLRARGQVAPPQVKDLLTEEGPKSAGNCLSPEEEEALGAGQLADNEVARLAVRCNPEVEAGLQRARAALSEAEALSYLPDLVARYEAEATPIRRPWRLDQTAMHKIGLGQEFPLGPKRSLSSQAAAFEGLGLMAAREQAILEVVAAVKTNLALARAASAKEAIVERHIAILDRLIEIATARLGSGLGKAKDIAQFCVERGSLQTGIYELRQRRESALARVNALLHRDVTAPLGISEIATMPLEVPDLAGLLGAVRDRSPRLRSLLAEIRAREAEVARAKADRSWPDLMVQGSYNVAPYMPDSYSGMVSLNLPWLNPGHRAKVRAAEARLEATRLAYERLQDNISAKVGQLVARLREIRESEGVLREEVLPQARSALDLSIAGYASGLEDLEAVLEAERGVLQVEMQLVEKRLEWDVTMSSLEALVGGLVAPVPGDESQ